MHDLVVRDLEQARNRTLGLTDLDDPTLVTQHDPLMSPLAWDLAHVGQQEELWLLRAGDPARPGMLPPAVDALYDAFKHPRAERQSLPLLPPVEARAYDHEVRGRVLDLIEHTPADELFTAGMVVQHEEQHDETMLATLQLRQGPPCCWGAGRCRPAATSSRIELSWAAGRSRLALTRPVSRSRSTTNGQRTPWTSDPSGPGQ
jgi:iron(II)-dependent oxidoreductase